MGEVVSVKVFFVAGVCTDSPVFATVPVEAQARMTDPAGELHEVRSDKAVPGRWVLLFWEGGLGGGRNLAHLTRRAAGAIRRLAWAWP